MKKIFICFIIIISTVVGSMATEKKPVKDININSFINETQVSPEGVTDNHTALCWWIPNEYWEYFFARDTTTSDADKKTMMNMMSGISLLAVVQADISSFGAFNYYSKEEIEEKMAIFYTDSDGKRQKLSPVQTINSDLTILLGIFKPILASAMGNMGNNLHFYVLDDKTGSSDRRLNPYKKGVINIQLSDKNGNTMNAGIEMPLDSLFVPRKCPNGKDAHISWNYCPWTGVKIEE